MSESDKASLKQDLLDLVADTPRTTVVVTKMGQFLTKARKEVGGAMRGIFVGASFMK